MSGKNQGVLYSAKAYNRGHCEISISAICDIGYSGFSQKYLSMFKRLSFFPGVESTYIVFFQVSNWNQIFLFCNISPNGNGEDQLSKNINFVSQVVCYDACHLMSFIFCTRWCTVGVKNSFLSPKNCWLQIAQLFWWQTLDLVLGCHNKSCHFVIFSDFWMKISQNLKYVFDKHACSDASVLEHTLNSCNKNLIKWFRWNLWYIWEIF